VVALLDETVVDWALAGGMSERRRSFAFGYGHLIVFPALAAIGVGVQLAIEASVGKCNGGDAAAVLATALAVYLLGLSIVIRRGALGGAPRVPVLASRDSFGGGFYRETSAWSRAPGSQHTQTAEKTR
jgi:hypothetical protein